MDRKKTIGIAAVLLILVAGGAFFMLSGNGERTGDDEAPVRRAFAMFSKARAAGNKVIVAKYISRRFTDAQMVYSTAVEEFAIKREGYKAEITSINMRENQAGISYTARRL